MSRISESQLLNGTWSTSYYGYDGHGSVRQLTDSLGTVTDTYDYDAFGNLIASTGTTPNNFLFAGEQFDPALGLYYNRARYLDVRNGRFWGMDPFNEQSRDPATLHRYLFVRQDPINRIDPSGKLDFDLQSLQTAGAAFTTLARTAAPVLQNVAGSIYLNLYRVPEIVEAGNNYLVVGLGAFEAMRILGSNILNYAESYSRGPVIRGDQFEEAAGANLGPHVPGHRLL